MWGSQDISQILPIGIRSVLVLSYILSEEPPWETFVSSAN